MEMGNAARRLAVALVLVTALLITAASTRAQDQSWQSDPNSPKLARGTGMQFGSFEFQEIDTISLMNRGVNLHIPIGQAYPAGGDFRIN